jgi:hypothetical protein
MELSGRGSAKDLAYGALVSRQLHQFARHYQGNFLGTIGEMALQSARLFSFLVGVLVLGGCGAGAGFPAQTRPLIPNQSNAASGARDRRGGEASWMAPDTRTRDLLYVSYNNVLYHNDGDGSILVYSYPEGMLKGRLSGFSFAGSLCSDKNGDVFIPAGYDILEFAHGGARPIAVLADVHGDAAFCAVDPTTGNLAVSPTVVVYRHARGKGKEYPGGNAYGNYSCTYDNNGNLFVNGTEYEGSFDWMGLTELRKGATQFAKINVPITLLYGTIQWDGKAIAVGTSYPAEIQRFRVVGKTAKFIAPPGRLISAGLGQFWIQGSTIIVPSYEPTAVMFYKYPVVGKPTKIIKKSPSQPFPLVGATVSLAPK